MNCKISTEFSLPCSRQNLTRQMQSKFGTKKNLLHTNRLHEAWCRDEAWCRMSDVDIGGLRNFAQVVVSTVKRKSLRVFRLKCWVANQVCATIKMTDLLRDSLLVQEDDEKKLAELAAQHAGRVHRRVSEIVSRFQKHLGRSWATNEDGWDVAFVAGKSFVRAYIHPDACGQLFKTAVQGGFIMYIDERGQHSFRDPVGTTTPMWSLEVAKVVATTQAENHQYANQYVNRYATCTNWQDTPLGMFSDLNRLLEFV